MDNQNLNQSGQEKNIPAPPPLEIDIRTMDTDIKALQERGGEVSETGIRAEYSAPVAAMKESNFRQDVPVSGYRGDEKPLFPASADIVSRQNQSDQASGQTSGKLKLILIAGGVLIGAFVLGLLGYYIIFPMIF